MDCVALVEGTLLATVQHWLTATEVMGVPLTDAIACTLGMQLSKLTGKVTRAKRALVAAQWIREVLNIKKKVVRELGIFKRARGQYMPAPRCSQLFNPESLAPNLYKHTTI